MRFALSPCIARRALIASILTLIITACPLTDPACYKPSDIITCDVAIIGGGSTGTYSAVSLKDQGKSVILVEKQDHLGGHAETYIDPATNYSVDIGVIVFANTTTVTDYFARFNVSLTLHTENSGRSQFVDFSLGRNVSFTPATNAEEAEAFQVYAQRLQKYPDLANSFNLTYPVEPDLLLPFGDFVAKYNLSAIVPTLFLINEGYVPLLNITTLYMFKYLNLVEIRSFSIGFLTTVNHDIQELYQNIAANLGNAVYLNSYPLAINRSDASQVAISIQTPTAVKLILAKKIISSIPPMLSNLQGYDLTSNETGLFSQFQANGYYTGIVNNSGLPNNTTLFACSANCPYHVPELPGPYKFQYNPGIDMFQVFYGSPTVLPGDQVKQDILNIIDRYKNVNKITTTAGSTPEFVAFSSHAPFNLHVSNEAIENGFYRELRALQGESNTFWTGAAFDAQDSSVLWEMLKQDLLPMVIESLG